MKQSELKPKYKKGEILQHGERNSGYFIVEVVDFCEDSFDSTNSYIYTIKILEPKPTERPATDCDCGCGAHFLAMEHHLRYPEGRINH